MHTDETADPGDAASAPNGSPGQAPEDDSDSILGLVRRLAELEDVLRGQTTPGGPTAEEEYTLAWVVAEQARVQERLRRCHPRAATDDPEPPA